MSVIAHGNVRSAFGIAIRYSVVRDERISSVVRVFVATLLRPLNMTILR